MLQLDSVTTLWAFAISSLILLFALLIFWRQIYRRSFLNFLLRLFLLVLCQVLILSTAGIAINRGNGFYSSWSDLFGKTEDYSAVTVSSDKSEKLNKSFLSGAEKAVNGQLILKEYVKGKQSGVSNLVYLILPKGVVANVRSGKPVDMSRTRIVEFLAGYPSQPEIWFRSLDIAKALAESEKSNPGVSVIGVIPAVNVAGSTDLECMNFPNNGIQTESWLSTDLHDFVNRKLGISPVRWGVMGVSAGGWCSAMLAVKREDLYYGAVSIAGYYRPALSKKTDPLVKSQLEKQYDFSKLESEMTGSTKMLLVASFGDIYSYKETKKFMAIQHPNIDYQYIEIKSGGHNARVWISQLGTALGWLKRIQN